MLRKCVCQCLKYAALASILSAGGVWGACMDSGLQIQVLGSGGPFGNGGLSSSSYLVWIDGTARIMIDAGGGTSGHFQQSGATVDDLEIVAISHFHPDHSAELPAILWPSGGKVLIAGPSGVGVFPSVEEFLDRLFSQTGAYTILGDRLDVETITVDASQPGSVEVWRNEEIALFGFPVPHADVPSIAYRVDYKGKSVAFSSDQNGSNSEFSKFVQDVNVLIAHMGREDMTGMIANLHVKPSVLGRLASDANVKKVVVSHIAYPDVLDENLRYLTAKYTGDVSIASDMMCIRVD